MDRIVRCRGLTAALTLLSLTLFAGVFLSCESREVEATKEEAATKGVSASSEDFGRQFITARITSLTSEAIPKAIETDARADAMRLCDVGRARVRSLGTVDDEPTEKVVEELDGVCSNQVPIYLLDRLAAEVVKSKEDIKQTRCEMGSLVMGFVHTHGDDSPGVQAAREKVFEVCPNLQAEWDEINERIKENPQPQ